MTTYEWKCPECGKACHTRVPFCSRQPREAVEQMKTAFEAVKRGEKPGPLCEACKTRWAEKRRAEREANPPPPRPPYRPSDPGWQKRALEAYEHRHEKPDDGKTSTVYMGIFFLDYDVFDSPEQKAFKEWMRAREDALLWRWWYNHVGAGKPDVDFGAERAVPPDLYFHASSWAELRQKIEAWDLSQGSQGNLRSEAGP